MEAEDTKGEMAMKYYGDDEKPLADITVNSKFVTETGYTGTNLTDQIVEYLSQVDKVKGWPNWLLGNANTERLASRLEADRGHFDGAIFVAGHALHLLRR